MHRQGTCSHGTHALAGCTHAWQGVHTNRARQCDMPARHHEVVYLLRTYVKGGLCPRGFSYMGVKRG